MPNSHHDIQLYIIYPTRIEGEDKMVLCSGSYTKQKGKYVSCNFSSLCLLSIYFYKYHFRRDSFLKKLYLIPEYCPNLFCNHIQSDSSDNTVWESFDFFILALCSLIRVFSFLLINIRGVAIKTVYFVYVLYLVIPFFLIYPYLILWNDSKYS